MVKSALPRLISPPHHHFSYLLQENVNDSYAIVICEENNSLQKNQIFYAVLGSTFSTKAQSSSWQAAE